ncbi:MAG: redox-sensing transcriptional repressor Rex [Planctomycetes bacterium]|nr:redox-sensing transcriptional repressor Rex [Planctomycetota bacterium]
MVNKGSVRIGNLPGIRRLPFYLNILRRLQGDGKNIISAVSLAEETGHPTPVVKKDIEMTGAAGKTGVGYDIDSLIADIEAFLGWNQIHDAILVGVGNLGSALLGYGGFKSHGLQFIAAFDADDDKVGKVTHGVEVLPLSKIKPFAARRNVRTAVITVPADSAQQAADLLVAAGITRIWNFAPVMLTVPETVMVQREDLSAGLAELLVRGRANENVEK